MSQVTRRDALGAVVASLVANSLGRASDQTQGPPLWVATRDGASGRVYIFGGAITTDHSWLTPKIKAAMNESMELWQEEPSPPCPFNRDLNMELGTRKTGKLFDDLVPAQQVRVSSAAKALGISMDLLQKTLPSAAGAIVAATNRPRAMSAYKVDDSQEMFLKMFQTRGAKVHPEFDKCDDPIHFYADFPQKAAVQYLMYQIDLSELPPSDFPRWSAEWLHGDLSGWSSFNRRLRTHYPDLYRVLEWKRNEAWATRIDSMLAQGGAHFIVVGVLHTVGPGSIQARVAAHSVTVKHA